jgi:hypothetical protein
MGYVKMVYNSEIWLYNFSKISSSLDETTAKTYLLFLLGIGYLHAHLEKYSKR